MSCTSSCAAKVVSTSSTEAVPVSSSAGMILPHDNDNITVVKEQDAGEHLFSRTVTNTTIMSASPSARESVISQSTSSTADEVEQDVLEHAHGEQEEQKCRGTTSASTTTAASPSLISSPSPPSSPSSSSSSSAHPRHKDTWQSNLVQTHPAVLTEFTREHESSSFTIRELRSGRTGIRTWPASLQLLDYLTQQEDGARRVRESAHSCGGDENYERPAQQRRVLELGTGVGVVALGLAKLGCFREVLATDHDKATLRNLRFNVNQNRAAASVRVKQLDWVSVQKCVGAASWGTRWSGVVGETSTDRSHEAHEVGGGCDVKTSRTSSSSTSLAPGSVEDTSVSEKPVQLVATEPGQQSDVDEDIFDDDFLVPTWRRDDCSDSEKEETGSVDSGEAPEAADETTKFRASSQAHKDQLLVKQRQHQEHYDFLVSELERGSLDLVVGSDLLYEDTEEPLLAVLHLILTHPPLRHMHMLSCVQEQHQELDNITSTKASSASSSSTTRTRTSTPKIILMFQERTEGRVTKFAEKLRRMVAASTSGSAGTTSARVNLKHICETENRPCWLLEAERFL
ncbi:unnamed protein product [Amoebophrya sp. A25]|nr:unnamed protein product [Amoebophrya sp. A25]|eukprot:GSA25T00002505001.1